MEAVAQTLTRGRRGHPLFECIRAIPYTCVHTKHTRVVPRGYLRSYFAPTGIYSCHDVSYARANLSKSFWSVYTSTTASVRPIYCALVLRKLKTQSSQMRPQRHRLLIHGALGLFFLLIVKFNRESSVRLRIDW